jgi:hypothetical protein
MEKRRILSFLGFTMAAGAGAGCLPGNAPPGVQPDAPQQAVVSASCKDMLAVNAGLESGAYKLRDGSGALYGAWCDMVDDGGGWTLVMKADGSLPASRFHYDDPLWESRDTLNDSTIDTSMSEAKYRAFTEVPFTQVRLVLASGPGNATMGALTLDASSTSFLSLMQSGYVPAATPRAQWIGLVPGAPAIQPYCNQGGINNFFNDPLFRVRIGMVANEQLNCDSPDSYIGVGGGGGIGNTCYPSAIYPSFVPPSAGVLGGGSCNPASPNMPNTPAFAYVYVR